jgi:hypothetical protein
MNCGALSCCLKNCKRHDPRRAFCERLWLYWNDRTRFERNFSESKLRDLISAERAAMTHHIGGANREQTIIIIEPTCVLSIEY